jgi:hypothetical protein
MTGENAGSIQTPDEAATSNEKAREIAWFEGRRWN